MKMIKTLALLIMLLLLILGLSELSEAKATEFRKFESGYIPPYNSVCTGYGQSCYMGFNNCTPVPNVPGTWNPSGYTPCQERLGCN